MKTVSNREDLVEIERLLPSMPFNKGMALVHSLYNFELLAYGSVDHVRHMKLAAIVHAAENERMLERRRLHPPLDWNLGLSTIGAGIRLLLKLLRGW